MMKKKIRLSILCSLMIPLFFSCVDGLTDESTLDLGDVNNTQMVTPSDSDVKLDVSADGLSAKISWPFQFGVLGYEIKFLELAGDGSILDTIANYAVYDGNSITFNMEEDAGYEFQIRSIANKKYNNFDAQDTTKKKVGISYQLMKYFDGATYGTPLLANGKVPPVEEITNTGVTDWFRANPINGAIYDYAIKYTFEPGYAYLLQNIDLFAGENQALVSASYFPKLDDLFDVEGYFVGVDNAPARQPVLLMNKAGFTFVDHPIKLKGLHFEIDTADVTTCKDWLIGGVPTGTYVIAPGDTVKYDDIYKPIFESKSSPAPGKPELSILQMNEPIVIQKCRINTLRRVLQTFQILGMRTLYIEDCFVTTNSTSPLVELLSDSRSLIWHWQFVNFTYAPLTRNRSNYPGSFVRFAQNKGVEFFPCYSFPSNGNTTVKGGIHMQFNYCSFINSSTGKWNNSSNYSGGGDAAHMITIKNTMFWDDNSNRSTTNGPWHSSNNGQTAVGRDYGYNSYWKNGVFDSDQVASDKNYDRSTNYFSTNPTLYDVDAADYRIQNTSFWLFCGDPRWWGDSYMTFGYTFYMGNLF